MGSPSIFPRLVLPALAVLAAATGCKVGPDFKPQPPPTVAQFGAAPLPPAVAGEAQRFLQGARVERRWWTTFGSPELTRRVERAFANSPTVASAQAAVRRARQNVVAAGGALWPSADLAGGFDRQKLGPGQGSTSPYSTYSATLSVSYTLDLFGGARRGLEGAQAQVDLSQWLLDGTYLSLAANVAAATIQEAALREQLQAARDVTGLLEEQAALTGRQLAIGAKAEGDLLAVQAQLAAARSALPPLGRQLEAVRNQLAVYLGALPSEAGAGAVALDDLKVPAELPVSLPSQVVAGRPDIQAAQALLHAATANVGAATAARLPQLTLGGAFGPQALRFQDLLKGDSVAWNLSAGVFQPLFRGGALQARQKGAEAGLDQALADYRQTVLVAFANVADALDALQFDAQALRAEQDAEAAAARSLTLVQAQYRLGAASYLQLLEATRAWHLARQGLIRARAAQLGDTTALYAALGGGL